MFLPSPFVFTVAGPARGDIAQLLPQADAVPEGSIWDLDDPGNRIVHTRNNLTTPQGMREWLAMTPGCTWLGRILIVNLPVTVTIQRAVLLSVGVGDLIVLLGAPLW